jgi:transcriptional regulator with XRE-family HTH domain
MNTLGKRLKKLRAEKGITQKELAAIIKVPRDTVANWEVSRGTPNIETISDIASYFDVSTDYLLGRTDDPSPIDDNRQHVNDDDALEYLEELHKRPEMKALFQVGRKATKEDIETAITIIEALKKKGGNNE